MTLPNFKQDILEAVGEQTIEAVVITDSIEYLYSPSDLALYPRDAAVLPYLGKILTWEQAAPLLDYIYDNGFGTRDCHLIELYTATDIYYVHEYDGATAILSISRNPTEYKQYPIGGN